MSQQRLVLTQLGVIAPLGIGLNAFRQGLHQATPKFGPLTLFPNTNAPPFYGGEAWGFDPHAILGQKGLRTLDRNTRLVLSCIQLDLQSALLDAGLENIGLALGTTYGSFDSLSGFAHTYLTQGFRALNPGLFPNLVLNSPPSQGNIRFQLTSSSTTLSNGTTSGLDALLFGASRILCGYEPCYLCGASEELSLPICEGMRQNQQLTSETLTRPLDQRADGTLPGEGTALFLLEAHEHAVQRGAQPRAELVGWGTCHDATWAYDAQPSAKAGAHAITTALEHAALKPEQIDMISVSADGRPAIAQAEVTALTRTFRGHLQACPVVAYAALWGACQAASSALQLAATLLDLERDQITGTPTCQIPLSPLWVPQTPLARPLQTALLLALGEAGQATALILKKPAKQR